MQYSRRRPSPAQKKKRQYAIHGEQTRSNARTLRICEPLAARAVLHRLGARDRVLCSSNSCKRSGRSCSDVSRSSGNAMIIQILSLIDGALFGSSAADHRLQQAMRTSCRRSALGDHEDRPAWMGKVGFSDLKIKLIGALVAISAVELLEEFIDVDVDTPSRDPQLEGRYPHDVRRFRRVIRRHRSARRVQGPPLDLRSPFGSLRRHELYVAKHLTLPRTPLT